MPCRQVGFTSKSVAKNLRDDAEKTFRESCEPYEHFWSVPSYEPSCEGWEYYCCTSNCYPDPSKIAISGLEDIDSKLVRQMFEKGVKITLDNGKLTLEIIEENITKNQVQKG